MTPGTIALIVGALLGTAGIGGIVGAVLTYKRGTAADITAALSKRLAEVEKDLTEQREWRRAQEERYSRLWAYTRSLIDYAYRHRKADSPPLPDMPDGLT